MYRTVFWTLWQRVRVGWFGRMALKKNFLNKLKKTSSNVNKEHLWREGEEEEEEGKGKMLKYIV